MKRSWSPCVTFDHVGSRCGTALGHANQHAARSWLQQSDPDYIPNKAMHAFCTHRIGQRKRLETRGLKQSRFAGLIATVAHSDSADGHGLHATTPNADRLPRGSVGHTACATCSRGATRSGGQTRRFAARFVARCRTLRQARSYGCFTTMRTRGGVFVRRVATFCRTRTHRATRAEVEGTGGERREGEGG